MLDSCGRLVLDLCAGARRELVLCAPFTKRLALERCLAAARQEIGLTLITRWRAEEVAAGVTDLEVLEVVTARGGRVLLHDRLHAKYFRTEDACLVGSANITGAALGWSWPSNLELLMAASPAAVAVLEEQLLREAVLADDAVRRALQAEVDALPAAERVAPELLGLPDEPIWWPSLRYPHALYAAYEQGLRDLPGSTAAAATKDLLALEPPLHLDKVAFYRLTSDRLWASPVLTRLRPVLREPRRFGAVVDEVLAIDPDVGRGVAEQRWQTLMRWLLTFCPERVEHRVARHSEVVRLL